MAGVSNCKKTKKRRARSRTASLLRSKKSPKLRRSERKVSEERRQGVAWEKGTGKELRLLKTDEHDQRKEE